MKHFRKTKGFQLVQLAGLILISLMVSALAVDFAFYYAAQNQMQTAADSAALAAATTLYHDVSVDPDDRQSAARMDAETLVNSNLPGTVLGNDDVVFGFIDPATRTYSANNFRAPSNDPDYNLTGGYNAVWVRVRHAQNGPNQALHTILANLFGVHSMNAEAQSVALVDQNLGTITDGGLRPIYACEEQFNRTMQDGVPENNVVRIYGDHVEVDGVQDVTGCPPMGSGNWGFADLTDCNAGTVGASTIREWFANGYPGTVNAGQCYSTKPGNFIPSIRDELDNLIANQTIFPVPLYNGWGGNGSNTHVDVSGFAGFKITDYKSNGSAASRYIEGRFYRHACQQGCSSGSNSGSAPGGALVKIRLASRS